MKRIPIRAVIALLLLAGSTLRAQTAARYSMALPSPPVPIPVDKILDPGSAGGILIGPYVGVDYNIHSGGFSTSDGRFICCQADDGHGLGLVAGGKAFIPLSDAFSISPRLLYEGRGGTFTGTPDTVPIFGQDQRPEPMILAKEFNASIGTVAIDLLASYTITDFGLYIAAGPSASYVISKDFRQTSTVASPSGATFLDGSTSREVFHGDIDFINTFQAALRGGVGANLQIADNLWLNPEALYGLPLTKFSKTSGWKGSTLQGTIGLLFAF